MSQIIKLNASTLKVHPRNREFFDDIEGEAYENFKKSIQEDGVITPLIVAPDMTVVSGHQRLKACLDLGLNQIPVIIREDLSDEDEKLKKLLATNFGRQKNSPEKQRKIAVQYVELCGMKQGDNQHSIRNNCVPKSKKEIAEELGISERSLDYVLEIERKLTPEVKELLDTGIISKTAASKIWTKLSTQEQKELLEEVGADKLKDMTINQQLKEAERRAQQAEAEKHKLEQRAIKAEGQAEWAERKISELEARKPEPIEKKVIPPEVLEENERLKNQNNALKKDAEKLEAEKIALKSHIQEIKRSTPTIDQYLDGINRLYEHIRNFMGNVTPYAYQAEEFNLLTEKEKEPILKQLQQVQGWIDDMKFVLYKGQSKTSPYETECQIIDID